MTLINACRFFPRNLLWICLAIGIIAAQSAASTSSPAAQASKSDQQGQSSAGQQNPPENPNAEFGGELSKASKEANKEAGNTDAKLALELRAEHSPIVTWIGRLIKVSPERAYVFSLIINFGILIWFFWMLLRAKLPQMFRDRTATIQKGIREAQAASAEAARRLKDIEARLAKLDTEVAEIRASAESEAVAEEARIHQAAEKDKDKIVQAAETEIAAIARNARRELKGYAATLAVDLASRKIRVDEPTDRALVHEFVDQLGRGDK